MLYLTPVTLDSGNCRLYVKDQNNKPLVIIDQGHLAAKYGAQYELYTHTNDGEPCSPILSEWELNSDIEQAFKR